MKHASLATVPKIAKVTLTPIQQHLRLIDRAREIYLNGQKRLEAEYFERIKHATEMAAGTAPAAEPDQVAVAG
jgi:hypothetical protein